MNELLLFSLCLWIFFLVVGVASRAHALFLIVQGTAGFVLCLIFNLPEFGMPIFSGSISAAVVNHFSHSRPKKRGGRR